MCIFWSMWSENHDERKALVSNLVGRQHRCVRANQTHVYVSIWHPLSFVRHECECSWRGVWKRHDQYYNSVVSSF